MLYINNLKNQMNVNYGFLAILLEYYSQLNKTQNEKREFVIQKLSISNTQIHSKNKPKI